MASLETLRSAACHGGTRRFSVRLGSNDSSHSVEHCSIQLDGRYESGRVQGFGSKLVDAEIVEVDMTTQAVIGQKASGLSFGRLLFFLEGAENGYAEF